MCVKRRNIQFQMLLETSQNGYYIIIPLHSMNLETNDWNPKLEDLYIVFMFFFELKFQVRRLFKWLFNLSCIMANCVIFFICNFYVFLLVQVFRSSLRQSFVCTWQSIYPLIFLSVGFYLYTNWCSIWIEFFLLFDMIAKLL